MKIIEKYMKVLVDDEWELCEVMASGNNVYEVTTRGWPPRTRLVTESQLRPISAAALRSEFNMPSLSKVCEDVRLDIEVCDYR